MIKDNKQKTIETNLKPEGPKFNLGDKVLFEMNMGDHGVSHPELSNFFAMGTVEEYLGLHDPYD